ncbi:hypothetical protein [Streptomyces sp. NPDC006640]|uniref:hypothetical protein n=1 Tax=unclassified Streptomyces TaxID=2593676 RepID=UPI0036C9452F
MARVRYLGPEPVTVPELGRVVEPDEIVEVPDARFEGYVCQPGMWEPIQEPKDEEPAAAPVKKAAAKSLQKEG